MFGLQNNKQDNQDQQDEQVMLKNVAQLTNGLNDAQAQTDDATAQPDDTNTGGFSGFSFPNNSDTPNTTEPTTTSSPTTSNPVYQPAQDSSNDPQSNSEDSTQSQPKTNSPAEPTTAGAATPKAPVDAGKLAEMKEQALQHLDPLVDHLDQTPEEMFKTTMMMIQANDNHTLIERALSAAKQIKDDKARAQAMLDIINEINYFSQAPQTDQPPSPETSQN